MSFRIDDILSDTKVRNTENSIDSFNKNKDRAFNLMKKEAFSARRDTFNAKKDILSATKETFNPPKEAFDVKKDANSSILQQTLSHSNDFNLKTANSDFSKFCFHDNYRPCAYYAPCTSLDTYLAKGKSLIF